MSRHLIEFCPKYLDVHLLTVPMSLGHQDLIYFSKRILVRHLIVFKGLYSPHLTSKFQDVG